MVLTKLNEKVFAEITNHSKVQSMKQFKQHGFVSTYEHCVNVLEISVKIADKWKLSETEVNNLIVGAMLHDFYLYDWHDGRKRKEGMHAWSHPKVALKNAKKCFDLNDNQQNIIRCHMYPTCFLHPPKCKEAWAVVLADKYCAIGEYFCSKFLHRKLNIKESKFCNI